MATSSNILLSMLSGSLGDIITVKNYNGKIVICKKIGSRKSRNQKATEKQKENEELFRHASEWASNIYGNPELREQARLRLKVSHGNALYRAILKECREEVKKQ